MDLKQLLLVVAIIAALSSATMVTSVLAQNMTVGNMTDAQNTTADINQTGSISSYTGCRMTDDGDLVCEDE
jgi:hypothetical protein